MQIKDAWLTAALVGRTLGQAPGQTGVFPA